jgi:nucleotide-binding universal stress UspA family protein
MFKRILVPLDGSTRAESALPVAARIARAYGGSLTLLQVVEATTQQGAYLEPLIEDEKAEATSYLEKVVTSAELAGVKTDIKVRVGAVAHTIITEAQASHENLIVMCSHGYTGFKRWALGSVAQKIARHAPVPVLILREGDTLSTLSPEKPVRALVPLDGSPFSEAVFEPAVYLVFGLAYSLAQAGEVHLLRVIDLPLTRGRMRSQANLDPQMQQQAQQEAQTYLSKLIARLDEGGLAELDIEASASVESDPDVAEAIVQQAEGVEAGKYDLIAMATHGHGGLDHFITGSVTERVLHTTKLPLLVVRPSQTEAARQEEAAEKEMVVVESMEIEMQM